MGVVTNVAPCGIICEGCPQQEDCKGGCHQCKGTPFYLKDFGVDVCLIYDCAVNQKGYTTCGECAELPCQIHFDWRDPSMTEEAFLESIRVRTEALKKGTGIGF